MTKVRRIRGSIEKAASVDRRYRLTNDPGAGHLDALLWAIQAAWAWPQREGGFGALNPLDTLKGWIADPTIRSY